LYSPVLDQPNGQTLERELMGRKDEWVTIPREQLHLGISKCLDKAKALLTDARILLKSSSLLHASTLFSFALEEFGKAILLKEALDLRSDDPAQIIGFLDHETKLQKLRSHVPEQWIQMFPGAFQGNAFQGGVFQVDVIADLGTRLKSLYVDWDERTHDWRIPPKVDETSLNKSLDQVEHELTDKIAKWA